MQLLYHPQLTYTVAIPKCTPLHSHRPPSTCNSHPSLRLHCKANSKTRNLPLLSVAYHPSLHSHYQPFSLRWTQKNTYFLAHLSAPLMKLLQQCYSVFPVPLLPSISPPFPLHFFQSTFSPHASKPGALHRPHNHHLYSFPPLPLLSPMLCLPSPSPSSTFISGACPLHPKPHRLSLKILLHPNYQVNPCCDQALTCPPSFLPDLEMPQCLPSSIFSIRRRLMEAEGA